LGLPWSRTGSNSISDPLNKLVVGFKQLGDTIGQVVVDLAPVLTRLDQPAIAKTTQVTAGIAGAQSCYCGRFTSSFLTIAQGFEQRQPREIGQTMEEPSPHKGVEASHLCHEANDSPFL
jgi:hypothetical protein